MTVDTKRLRELAESATPGPWRYGVDVDQLSDGGKGYPLDYYPDCRTVVEISCRECGQRSDIAEPDAAFIAAANPQTVIALLDEIEALRHIDEHVQQNRASLAEQLAAMTAARDEACDLVSDCLDRMTSLVDEHGDTVTREPGYLSTEQKLAALRKVGQ